MYSNISQDFHKVLRELPKVDFETVDTNSDGFLSLNELKSHFSYLHGIAVEKLYEFLDRNHDGRVTSDEFQFYVDHLNGQSKRDNQRNTSVINVFDKFEAYVTMEDLDFIYGDHSDEVTRGDDKVRLLDMTGGKLVLAQLRGKTSTVGDYEPSMREDDAVSNDDAGLFILTGMTQEDLIGTMKRCPMKWWEIFTTDDDSQDKMHFMRETVAPGGMTAKGWRYQGQTQWISMGEE